MDKKYIIKGEEVDGWRPVLMCDGTGYTYLHADGHLMPHRFDYASEFHDKMAGVSMKDGKPNQKATYVTAQERVFDLRFSEVLPFYGDTATAYIGNEEYFVTKDQLCFQFKNTILDKLKPASEDDKSGIFLYNCMTGQAFTTIFKILRKGREGMIPIEMKDGSGQTFMDAHFNIMRHRFLEVGNFMGGLAPGITFSGQLMYVDKNQEIYTERQIEQLSAEYFKKSQEQLMNFGYYDMGMEEENDEEYDENGI